MTNVASKIMPTIRESLMEGVVIPASPLALDRNRQLDEWHQRGLCRYYAGAGAGGIAVGVHTTQFAIRDPKIGLFEPLLVLAAEEFDRADSQRDRPMIRVAGICGQTKQAVAEAALARDNEFQMGLLNLAALRGATLSQLINHCRTVADVIPLFGFYLQPAIGGIRLSYTFWRQFLEIPSVVAIKVATFNRYQTIDVVRALAESGREDVALYTGNDDNIVLDLLTSYRFVVDDEVIERRFVGGLLGHWACWTRRAVELLEWCHAEVSGGDSVSQELLQRSVEVTDANAALFDVENGYGGCIPGIHEVLFRQGLLEGIWCLNPDEVLGPGQREAIDRVCRVYPHLTDDAFVAEHRDAWHADSDSGERS